MTLRGLFTGTSTFGNMDIDKAGKKMNLPEIGDIITTKEALALCRHFGLGKSGDMT
jgi:hypothetical protein